MHLTIVLFTLFATWRWGDWKNWNKYHTTMLYVAISNLFYNFIYADHLLWQLKPFFLYNHNIGEIFYSFIVFPFTALILLTNYPYILKEQIFRIVKFVVIYIAIEWVLLIFGRIDHKYGWTIWWSLAWDCMMFPMWVLHFKKPLAAYIVSILIVILVTTIFPVPIGP